MKKLLLVAAIGVAGIMSANTIAVKENYENEEMNKEIETTLLSAVEFSCISYSTSCGWPGFACGNSFVEILNEIARFDNELCS